VSKNKEECRQTGSVTVPVMSGTDQYLASVVTEETNCGSLDTPWTLRAPPGQTIHVHLLNFQTAARPTPGTQHNVPNVCQVWIVLLSLRCTGVSNSRTILTFVKMSIADISAMLHHFSVCVGFMLYCVGSRGLERRSLLMTHWNRNYWTYLWLVGWWLFLRYLSGIRYMPTALSKLDAF